MDTMTKETWGLNTQVTLTNNYHLFKIQVIKALIMEVIAYDLETQRK